MYHNGTIGVVLGHNGILFNFGTVSFKTGHLRQFLADILEGEKFYFAPLSYDWPLKFKSVPTLDPKIAVECP